MSAGLLLLLALAAQSASEPPRTVNGIELGPAEEFTTLGPATVCLRELVLTPKAGQSVQLIYSGIHTGTLRLTLSSGAYIDFNDGEIFRDQRRRRQSPVVQRDNLRVYRLNGRRTESLYQIEGVGRQTEDHSPPRVMVEGTALAGDPSDYSLFESVDFKEASSLTCDRRYAYGWDVILEGAPVKIDGAEDAAGEEN